MHPGDEDVAGHAPAHRVQPPRRAGAEHRARDRVRRRDREAVVRGRTRGSRRVAVCAAKPSRRVELGDARPERLDDPPAARVGAEPHRERRRSRSPRCGGRSKSADRWPDATSASAMMPIVFCASFVPCVKRDEPAGDELEPPEDAVDDARRAAAARSRAAPSISAAAPTIPRNGARSDGISTLSHQAVPLRRRRARRPRSPSRPSRR